MCRGRPCIRQVQAGDTGTAVAALTYRGTPSTGEPRRKVPQDGAGGGSYRRPDGQCRSVATVSTCVATTAAFEAFEFAFAKRASKLRRSSSPLVSEPCTPMTADRRCPGRLTKRFYAHTVPIYYSSYVSYISVSICKERSSDGTLFSRALDIIAANRPSFLPLTTQTLLLSTQDHVPAERNGARWSRGIATFGPGDVVPLTYFASPKGHAIAVGCPPTVLIVSAVDSSSRVRLV